MLDLVSQNDGVLFFELHSFGSFSIEWTFVLLWITMRLTELASATTGEGH